MEKKGAEAEKKNVEIDLVEARNLRALVEKKYEKLKREHKRVTEQLQEAQRDAAGVAEM